MFDKSHGKLCRECGAELDHFILFDESISGGIAFLFILALDYTVKIKPLKILAFILPCKRNIFAKLGGKPCLLFFNDIDFLADKRQLLFDNCGTVLPARLFNRVDKNIDIIIGKLLVMVS